MKHILLSFLALTLTVLGQTQVTPINNGKLTTALNGNTQDITALDQLGLGAGTPTNARIHIRPGAAPTTAADGIRFGDDVVVYRSSDGTLRLTGNLSVSGTISGASGVVQLAGANIFSGANTFNSTVTLAGSTIFQAGFTVADSTVRNTIRDSLDLVPGTDVMAYSALLQTIAGLNPQDGYVMVGNGTTWVVESGSTARTSLGLGTGDNVTFTNGTLSGTLAVTGASTLTGKVTIAGASSDATGLQFGSAGALYGSGSGVVSDDALTINNEVTVGLNTSSVLLVKGVLTIGTAGDLNFTRTGTAAGSVSGTLAMTGLTLTNPLGTTYGGTGLDLGSLAADRYLYTSGTGVLASGTITAQARLLLDDAAASDQRSTLGLGTVATYAVQTGSTATNSQVVLGSDTRLTDSRAPSGSAAGAGSDVEGTYPDAVTIKADAVTLATDTVGNYVASLSAGTGVTLTGTNGIENAVPVVSIGQSVATGASPTFNGATLTGGLTGTTGAFSGAVSAASATLSGAMTSAGATISGTTAVADLTISGSLTMPASVSLTTATIGTLTLEESTTPTVGKVAGLLHVNDVHVAKDNSWDTDTRTGLNAYDEFRPFTSVSAATTAAVGGDTVRVHPATTEYTVPAEFGAGGCSFYLEPGAMLDGVVTTTDLDYNILGPGSITGDVALSHADAVVTIRSNITGNVALSAGTLVLHGTVTGDITVTGGTLEIHGPVTGSLAITTGTVRLYNRLERTSSGTAVTLTSGALNCEEGAQILASSSTETGVSQTAGTWTVRGPLGVRGALAGGGLNPVIEGGGLTYYSASITGYMMRAPTLLTPTFNGTTTTGAITATGAVNITGATGITGATTVTGNLSATGSVRSTSTTTGVGYATGAGGTATEAANVATLTKMVGTITTSSLSNAAAGEYTITVSNSLVAAGDVVVPVITTYSGTGTPAVFVRSITASTGYVLTVTNLHASEALNSTMVITVMVFKGATS